MIKQYRKLLAQNASSFNSSSRRGLRYFSVMRRVNTAAKLIRNTRKYLTGMNSLVIDFVF